MWIWIVANRQWVFSGAGISILAAAWWSLRKMGLLGSNTAAPVQTNTNSVIQSPVIHINLPQPSLPAEPKIEPLEIETLPVLTGVPDTKPEEEPDLRPQIYSLTPRITYVSENDDPEEGNGGIIEGGNSLRAVVATFRMKKPSPDGNDTYLTARLSYRTRENIIIRDIEKEIHRVNYGTWLGEEYNHVKMRITDTKELVLTLQADGSDVCLAVQDNRSSATKYNGLAFHKLEPNADSFFVGVTLVDANHGPVITYTYKIDVDPLRVHEIIRVPRP
jgi:hypothetical protein